MSIYAQFETVNGTVAKKFAPNADGTIPTFYLARMAETNREFQLAMATALAPYSAEIRLGVFKNEKKQEIFNNVFAEYIVKGWENIQDREGNNIPYSKDACVSLLNDLPDLYDVLYKFAGEISNFLVANQEADAKN